MNYSIVFKLVSVLTGVMCVAFSLCAAVSAVFASEAGDAEAFPSWVCIIALTITAALSLYLPSRNAPKRIFRKEALCAVGVVWILAVLLGALPYMFILGCGFSNALFESASGLTSTGASVFGDVECMPKSLLFWRSFSQWIGGLGVVVFFVAILSFIGSGAKMMYSHEASANANGSIETERIKSAIFKIFVIYSAISTACWVSFVACGMGWFDGLCHMCSTVSTGGFSVYNDSIAHYESNLIAWIVTVFMFIGGISFFTMLNLFRGKFIKFATNSELITYIAILLIATLATTVIVLKDANLADIDTWGKAITKSCFQCVSMMTSTGFITADYQTWLPAAHAILFALMVIGGCAGSTSGGLKVSRALAGIKLLRRELERVLRPRVVRNVRIDGKTFDESETTGLFSFITLYSFCVLLGTLCLSLSEPQMSLIASMSACVSALSNVGPGFNETGPVQNYGFMSDISKTLLSILMVMGRLEFYSILILFMPSLWKKFQ